MIFSVSHQNISLAVDRNSFQPLELAVVLSPTAKASQKCSVRIENLNSVISGISNKDKTLLIDSNTPEIKVSCSKQIICNALVKSPWELELSFLRSFRTECGQNLSVDVENLQSVIVGVGDDHPVRVTDSDVVRVLQLSGLVTHTAKLGDECSVALEHLDPVILLVADVDESESVSTDSPRIVELSIR